MTYEDLYVLIPSHSLEDFPTELGDEEAAGLLNAFAVLWHPQLLASVDSLPRWHRSDEPPETLENRLVIIPKVAEEWLPGGWAGYAEKQGAVVVKAGNDRAVMIAAAVAPLDSPPTMNPELVADFLALGTAYLQIELLTTRMHHFSNLDEVDLQREAIAAAQAAVSGDDTGARAHLKNCFETLLEARERFYPVDCYLVDLCLLIPRLADEHLEKALTSEIPFNLLISGKDLQTIADDKPRIIELLREAWEGGRVDVAGGEWDERPSPLLPVESVVWDLHEGQRVFRELVGRTPKTWGRRRFGFSTNLPQILHKFGYNAALHIALDDGLYPDAEQSKIRWEGCDGTVVDAITRIPLAGDSAGSYLRFPERMAESMEQDHVAAIIIARWPEVKAPWFDDLRRIHSYAPVLGRFVTLEEFFEQTDDPGRMSTFEAGEYLSPFLVQSVAREEPDASGRYARHQHMRQQFEEAAFFRNTAALLRGEPLAETALADVERRLETAGPDYPNQEDGPSKEDHQKQIAETRDTLQTFHKESVKQLADVILHSGGGNAGFLVFNPYAFSRRVPVHLPELQSPPEISGPIKAVQFDDRDKVVSVELPSCGFAWIPANGQGHVAANAGPPLAEDGILRNELFEVWLNSETGGIGRVKHYGRTPNRLSQQLAFRFPRERTWKVGEGESAQEFTSFYSEMKCRSMTIRSAGPLLGEIESVGDLIDQTNGTKLAGFTQTYRIYRGLPYVDVDLQLDVDRMPDGDPWTNYIAARFAYNDMTAALTRSVQQGAQGIQGQRFESPHYLEIATPEDRTTIAFHGQTFHRKTGDRMIDSLLVVPGDTERRFRFRIAVDVDYPMQPALDLLSPPTVLPVMSGPPASGPTGWFFHMDAKNVQMLRIMGVMNEPVDDGYSSADDGTPPHADGFAVRLLETEGRSRRVKLRCFRTPHTARQRDFQGRTLNDLPIEGDNVLIDIAAYEIADVELRF